MFLPQVANFGESLMCPAQVASSSPGCLYERELDVSTPGCQFQRKSIIIGCIIWLEITPLNYIITKRDKFRHKRHHHAGFIYFYLRCTLIFKKKKNPEKTLNF
jgi:hypothetical protein